MQQDGSVKVTVEVESDESDAWSGHSGPMWNFFDFLKGCGFIFNPSDEIGIMRYNEDGTTEFISASRWEP
jgi:hypothetical protein